ncbi:MAG: amidohydrolase family protein, partial [Chitinophagaceae bacterium]|nr:amidohydrolase family protein [Chitinophagaceae bacterium]
RTEADRLRLIEAVKDGTVDCIATHHLPHEADSKVSEFEYARNGMTGLETAFSVLNTVIPNEPERWVRLLSSKPRALFGLPTLSIEEGQKATLTLFDPEKEWTYTLSQKRSRSQNSPFFGKTLRGKVWGIINKDQLILNP